MSKRIDSQGYIHYDVVVNKKRFCGNTGHKDKRLAAIWVSDFKAKVRREMANEVLGFRPEVTLTCEALLGEWLAHHGGKHARNIRSDWGNHILPWIGNVLAMKVTSGMVEEIRTRFLNSPCLTNNKGKVGAQIRAKVEKARLEGKKVTLSPLRRHSNAGANKVLRHLYFVFGWAVKTDRLPRLPFRKLKELVEQEPVRTFLRPEQVKPFLAELDSLQNLPVMVAVRAMLYMGLREGEALTMKWSGFDKERRVYTAVDTKTGENTPLPVPEDLRGLLARLREEVPEGCCWVLPAGYDPKRRVWNHRHSQFTTKPIKRAGEKLGIKGLTPHRMRGSMATLMARSGANAFVIKKAGRWKRMDTALRYIQIMEDDLVEAQAKAFGL
ncbi:MAG: integrase [Holophagaceae bacterium]|nr:integrase [Holophagaceae bacterium]